MSTRSPIESAIHQDNWTRAEQLIRVALKNQPGSHWYWTRLSVVLYEKRQYARALKAVERARVLAPKCPLVLWDYAGALQMLNRDLEAIKVYRSLVRRRVHSLATGDCGEGRAWARGLVADCFYRMGQSLEALGQREAAQQAFGQHLSLRGPGCHSIYSLAELAAQREPTRQRRKTVA